MSVEQHQLLKEYLISKFPDYTWDEIGNLSVKNTLINRKKSSFDYFLSKNYIELHNTYENLLQHIPQQYKKLIVIDFYSFVEHLFRYWDRNEKTY